MWLLKAVGPVHGQKGFTFALEQKKTYTVGRDKGCDIRFEDKYVKPVQGQVIVDDWDPTKPTIPPTLRWKSEPNKKGIYPSFKTITPTDEALISSQNIEHYEQDELQEGTQGCFLNENPGQGILLNQDCWFTTSWVDMSICYDKMNNEEDQVKNDLRAYCIAWTQAFDTLSPPTYVLSSTYRNTAECNNAVCLGVRILRPQYIRTLLNRILKSWKKVADSQDSFNFPDPDDSVLQPDLDESLPASRRAVEAWLPDPRRRNLFEGWSIMGLRARHPPTEKRWLTLMGADYNEIDVASSPLLSADDFKRRTKQWLNDLDASGSRSRGLVVQFMRVKEELTKNGVDYQKVVVEPSIELGLIQCTGAVCWAAVRVGDVQEYLDTKSGVPRPAASTSNKDSNPLDMPLATPFPSQAGQSTQRPDFIPSTFPQETSQAPAPPPPSTKPIVDAEERNVIPETTQDTAPAKKPLRKRAARKVDLFGDLSFEEAAALPPPSQPAEPSQVPIKQSQGPSQSMNPGSKSRLKRRAGGETQSSQFDFGFGNDDAYYAEQKRMEKEEEIRRLYEETKAETGGSMGPPQTKRRRVGSPDTNGEDPDPDVTIRPGARQTRQVSGSQDVDMDDEEDEVVEVEDPIQRTLRLAREAKNQRNVSGASTTSKVTAPSTRTSDRLISEGPSEPPEEVEERRPSSSRPTKAEPSSLKRPPQPLQKTSVDPATQNEPTTDPQFLQAISTASKTKKAVDELDKQFNDLKIPKPSAGGNASRNKGGGGQAVTMMQEHPDWDLVNGFDDDLRGNFIQIVKKDLFRKDLGLTKTVERVDDGRPNFKKFKKKNIVRREPLQLVLAAPTIEDAEMGEPYWQNAAQPSHTYRRAGPGQASQIPSTMPDEEDEMPLLPRSKKKRLIDIEEDDDDDDVGDGKRFSPALSELPPTSKRGRKAPNRAVDVDLDLDLDLEVEPDPEPGSLQDSTGSRSTGTRAGAATTTAETGSSKPTAARGGRTQRKTRASSVVSDAPSVAASTRSSGRTRAAATGTGTGSSRTRTVGRRKGVNELEPITVGDSEDEVALEIAAGASTKTPASRGGATRAATTTLEADSKSVVRDSGRPTTGRGTGLGTQSRAGTRGTQRSMASGTGTRRRLLVEDEDEDDDTAMPNLRTATKKRRL